MDLFLGDKEDSLFLRLLSHYTRFQNQPQCQIIHFNENTLFFAEKNPNLLKLPHIPSLVRSNDLFVTPFAIAQVIVERTHTDQYLLGDNEIQNAQPLYLNQLTGKIQISYQKQLNQKQEYQQQLRTKTFLIKQNISIADLVLFAYLYETMCLMDDATKLKFNHVYRWYNHIQNMEPIVEFYKQQGMTQTEFPTQIVQDKKKKK